MRGPNVYRCASFQSFQGVHQMSNPGANQIKSQDLIDRRYFAEMEKQWILQPGMG